MPHLGVQQNRKAATVQAVVILDLINDFLMAAVVTMAHVETADVDALVPHLNDGLLSVRSRTQCCNNLCLAHVSSVQDAVVHRVEHSLLSVVVCEAPAHTGRTVAQVGVGLGSQTCSVTEQPQNALDSIIDASDLNAFIFRCNTAEYIPPASSWVR